MFYIVETEEQLNKFSEYDLEESFIEPILFSDNLHYAINEVIAYYVKPHKSRTGFILPLNHSETFSLPLENVLSFFRSKVKKAYTSDKKKSSLFLQLGIPVICLKTLNWMLTGQVIEDSSYNTVAHNFLYNKYPDRLDVNRLVPICKHQEKWNNYVQDNKKLLSSKVQNTSYFKFYNDHVTIALGGLERGGIKVDLDAMLLHYPEAKTDRMVFDGRVHSYYNFHTATGRPSNNCGGINFGAMNKADNSREFIIPSNDVLVEFDYHSYHPNILANLVGYTFQEPDIHSHLARLYFNTENPTDQEYTESKTITFKALYTASEEYDHLEFFKKVKEFKDDLWVQYRRNRHIPSILSKRPITNIDSKTQVLPYLLQSYETERNVVLMQEVQDYLLKQRMGTKLISYSYDAFLVDFDKQDGPEVLEKIQNILETDGYSVSVKFGKDYARMCELAH